MPLSAQQRCFLYTHNHPTVQGVKQRESAASVTRLNKRIQALQEQQVARDHRTLLREQRNLFLVIISAIILIAIAILLFVQHTSHNEAKRV
jgi:hypothetical protein